MRFFSLLALLCYAAGGLAQLPNLEDSLQQHLPLAMQPILATLSTEALPRTDYREVEGLKAVWAFPKEKNTEGTWVAQEPDTLCWLYNEAGQLQAHYRYAGKDTTGHRLYEYANGKLQRIRYLATGRSIYNQTRFSYSEGRLSRKEEWFDDLLVSWQTFQYNKAGQCESAVLHYFYQDDWLEQWTIHYNSKGLLDGYLHIEQKEGQLEVHKQYAWRFDGEGRILHLDKTQAREEWSFFYENHQLQRLREQSDYMSEPLVWAMEYDEKRNFKGYKLYQEQTRRSIRSFVVSPKPLESFDSEGEAIYWAWDEKGNWIEQQYRRSQAYFRWRRVFEYW